MKYFRNRYLVLVLVAVLSISGSAFARRPTYLSPETDLLGEKPIVMMQPVTIAQGKPIAGFLGKTLNIPKSVKLDDVGFLVFALSNEAIQAYPTDQKDYHKSTVLPYLLESKVMRDVLALRRSARQIRFQSLREAVANAKHLNAEQKQAVNKYMSQSVGAPLLIMSKPPMPSFLPKPGPCMIPMGAELLESRKGPRIGLETAMICVMDLKSGNEVMFSLSDAISNDTLGLVVAHETAHAIQFDLYGKLFHQIQRVSTNGHDAPYITDLGLAYIEGWAEAFEAVYGPNNPKLKEKDRSKYNISEFLFSRQDPIRRGRYIWAAEAGRRSGVLKNGAQLMATEGVVAGIFYDILTNRSISAPFDKCVSTMLTSPMDFMGFIRNFVELFPEDKQTIYRIVLEGTRYVTMDINAQKAYFDYYRNNVDYKQKKVSRAEFEKSKNAYRKVCDEAFKRAMKGADIFANVGPQLWFQGTVDLAPARKKRFSKAKSLMNAFFGKKDNTFTFRLDINTATVDMMRMVGFAEPDARAITEARDQAGFFKVKSPVAVLKKVLGAERFAKYNAVYNFKHYDHEKADIIKDYHEQSLALWPEDLQKMAEQN